MNKLCALLLLMVIMCVCVCGLAEEDNEDLSKATKISVNSEVREFISSARDTDCFCFELGQPGRVTISFSHEYEDSDLRWRVELLDADSNVYMEQGFEGRTFSTEETCVVGLPSGTYYIKVTPYYLGYYFSGIYTFRVNYEESNSWETEFNDNIAYSSDPIPLNMDISGSLSRQKDVDYYRFEIFRDGPVSISFSHEYEDTELRWTVELLNAEGMLLTAKSFRGDSMTRIDTSAVGLPKGTYYIKIRPYYNSYFSPKTYTLRVNYSESDLWETEKNDNIASGSDPIPLNTGISGAMNLQDDVDWFRFDTDTNCVVNIAFSHEYEDSELRWGLEVLDAEKNIYYKKAYRGDAMTEIVSSPLGLQPGQYFIKIYPYYNSYYCSSIYTVRVDCEVKSDWETENNNSPVNADNGELGHWIHGAVATDHDEDYYRYELSQESDYIFHFQHDANSSSDTPWRVDVLDQNQKSLYHWAYKGTEITDIENTVKLQPGIYYVMVSSNYSNAPGEAYCIMLE